MNVFKNLVWKAQEPLIAYVLGYEMPIDKVESTRTTNLSWLDQIRDYQFWHDPR